MSCSTLRLASGDTRSKNPTACCAMSCSPQCIPLLPHDLAAATQWLPPAHLQQERHSYQPECTRLHLDATLATCTSTHLQQQRHVLDFAALGGVSPRLLVGHQPGGGGQDGVDHLLRSRTRRQNLQSAHSVVQQQQRVVTTILCKRPYSAWPSSIHAATSSGPCPSKHAPAACWPSETSRSAMETFGEAGPTVCDMSVCKGAQTNHRQCVVPGLHGRMLRAACHCHMPHAQKPN